jgi:hypothetical protein
MRKSLLAIAAITVVAAASLISHQVGATVPASAGIQAAIKAANSIQAVGCVQRRVCSRGVCTMRRVCT